MVQQVLKEPKGQQDSKGQLELRVYQRGHKELRDLKESKVLKEHKGQLLVLQVRKDFKEQLEQQVPQVYPPGQ